MKFGKGNVHSITKHLPIYRFFMAFHLSLEDLLWVFNAYKTCTVYICYSVVHTFLKGPSIPFLKGLSSPEGLIHRENLSNAFALQRTFRSSETNISRKQGMCETFLPIFIIFSLKLSLNIFNQITPTVCQKCYKFDKNS